MELLDKYIENLQSKKNLLPNTLEIYEITIKDYLYFLETNNKNILNLDRNLFDEYFKELEKKYKKSSYTKKYSIIRGFYKFLVKNRYLKEMFSYSFTNNNTPESLTQNLKKQEINNFEYKNFINSLSENFNEIRLSIIIKLIIEANINLTNIFDIQIKELLRYDFKKIVIERNKKIFSFDLNENLERELKNFYNNYALEKRFLFGAYTKSSFKNDLAKYNLDLRSIKNSMKKIDADIQEKIREIYFKIGIGDK